jgi:hypothetical protein
MHVVAGTAFAACSVLLQQLPRVHVCSQCFIVMLVCCREVESRSCGMRLRSVVTGSHSLPFRTSAATSTCGLQPMGGTHVRLRPPLRLLPPPVELQPGAQTLLSVDTEPQRIMDTFIRYGLLAVPSAQCNAVYGNAHTGTSDWVLSLILGTAVNTIRVFKIGNFRGTSRTNFGCSI